jgi:hypothetical protein
MVDDIAPRAGIPVATRERARRLGNLERLEGAAREPRVPSVLDALAEKRLSGPRAN